MANPTKYTALTAAKLGTPENPVIRVKSQVSATGLVITVTDPGLVDETDTALTTPLVIAVKHTEGEYKGYVENIGIETISADGTTLTAYTNGRGLKPNTTDFTVGSATLAKAIPQGSIVEIAPTAQHQLQIDQVFAGTLPTGGSVFNIGSGSGNPTIQGDGDGFIRRNTSTNKAEYSNDGTTWIEIDDISASNLCLVSADDTSPGYLDGKLTNASGITFTVNDPAGDEDLEIGYDTAVIVDVDTTQTITGEKQFSDIRINEAVQLTATSTEINQALDTIGATVTAANLDTLTDGSNADALHLHDIKPLGLSHDSKWFTLQITQSPTAAATNGWTVTDVTTPTNYASYIRIAGSAATWSLIYQMTTTPGKFAKDIICHAAALVAVTAGDRHILGMCNSTQIFIEDYNANASNNTFAGFVSDGTTLYAKTTTAAASTTLTDISAGITITSTHAYTLVINPGTDVKFYVDGVLKATHTTHVGATAASYVCFGSGGTTNGESTILTYPILSFEI